MAVWKTPVHTARDTDSAPSLYKSRRDPEEILFQIWLEVGAILYIQGLKIPCRVGPRPVERGTLVTRGSSGPAPSWGPTVGLLLAHVGSTTRLSVETTTPSVKEHAVLKTTPSSVRLT